jgi:hypothetical protein
VTLRHGLALATLQIQNAWHSGDVVASKGIKHAQYRFGSRLRFNMFPRQKTVIKMAKIRQFQLKLQNHVTLQRRRHVNNNEKVNVACYFSYKVDVYCKLKTKFPSDSYFFTFFFKFRDQIRPLPYLVLLLHFPFVTLGLELPSGPGETISLHIGNKGKRQCNYV